MSTSDGIRGGFHPETGASRAASLRPYHRLPGELRELRVRFIWKTMKSNLRMPSEAFARLIKYLSSHPEAIEYHQSQSPVT